MGFRGAEVCYESLEGVALEKCVALGGVSSAGAIRCTGVSPVVGGYVLDVETQPAVGAPLIGQIGVAQIGCDPMEPYTDMSLLFGMMLVATLGVYLVKTFVYKLVMPQ